MTAPPQSHRLFFAIWPHEAAQEAIARQVRPLIETSGGRAIPPANLHVTLVFLGQIAEPNLEKLKACAASVCDLPAFVLRVDRLEAWMRSRVLCLTTHDVPSALSQLVEGLQFKLLSEQFHIRQQEFRAHVTVARDVCKSVPDTVLAPVDWSVERFALVESRRGPAGSVYTTIGQWGLSPASEKEIARMRR